MSYSGTVKSFNSAKGFGFIDVQGQDVFVHMKECTGGVPQQGDMVYFDIADSPTKPGSKVATNVTGGTAAARGVMGNASCQGTIKSFSAMNGFGFILYQGQDVFVHMNDCQGGLPRQGDTVAFDLEESASKPGTMKATRVTGGSGDLSEAKGAGKGKGKDFGGGFGPMWGAKGGWGGSGPYGGGMGKGYDGGMGKGYDGGMGKGFGGGYGGGMGKGYDGGMGKGCGGGYGGGMGKGYDGGMGNSFGGGMGKGYDGGMGKGWGKGW